ncbi:MAG: hypothetical protein ACI93R_004159 [Flavobacteriales bacterium]
MRIRELNAADYLIEDLHLIARGDDMYWDFKLDSDAVIGDVRVPVADEPIELNLTRVNVYSDEETLLEEAMEKDDAPLVSVFADWDLSSLIDMNVKVDSFFLDDEDFGSWQFELRPEGELLKFTKLQADLKYMHVGGEAGADFDWTYGENIHSYFRGEILISGVGDSLVAWEEERLLDAKSAAIQLDARWDEHPDVWTLENIDGDVSLEMLSGNFIRSAEVGENPLLRLIALFNFDTLARRLRLDFSDLAAKGFAFDKVYGDMSFKDGTYLLAQPLIVESSSSKMQMAGTIDVAREKIDADLVVTLPVAGNLAVATAFIVGLPAGLGVYVVSKMFGRQVDKVSSINYTVKGGWDDPKLKVRKIFDDSGARKKGKLLEERQPNMDDSMDNDNDNDNDSDSKSNKE